MRFSGFDDEWNEVKLGDISTFLDNKRIPLKEDDRKQIKGEYPYYGASGIIDYVNDYIFDEELILMGEDGANIVTRSSKLIFLAKGKYWVNNHAHVIKADNNINQYFLSESLERINYEKYNTGTAQPKLNREVCQKIKVKIPQFNEQNKIANFLLVIDEKLRLLEQKYQYYQNFKKYLMQQIFTQKLRFNFTDDWNYMNFSEIFKSVSTKKYQIKSADILDKGDFEVIDQGQDEIAGYFNDKTKLCQELPIIIYGDHTTFVKFRDKPFIVGADGVKLLIPKFNANPKYLFYALEHFNIKPEGYKRHFSIIEKIKLPIPTLEEQNEISEIFNYIDIKLKYTKIQLQETEEFKKGLLQQMFIVRINWRCNFRLAKSPSFNKHLLILKNKIIFIIIE